MGYGMVWGYPPGGGGPLLDIPYVPGMGYTYPVSRMVSPNIPILLLFAGRLQIFGYTWFTRSWRRGLQCDSHVVGGEDSEAREVPDTPDVVFFRLFSKFCVNFWLFFRKFCRLFFENGLFCTVFVRVWLTPNFFH